MFGATLPLAFHSPGVAFVAIALLLGVVSLVLIARGIMLLVQYGGELNAKGKALFLLIPVLLLSSSPIIGFYAAFPFGVFAGILFAAVAGPGDDSRIYLSVWCLLNSLGIYGFIGLFRRKLSLKPKEY